MTELSNREILWHGKYLDGKLTILAGDTEDEVLFILIGFDTEYTGSVTLVKEKLVGITNEQLSEQILSAIAKNYLHHMVEIKNKDIADGARLQ